MEKKKIEKKVWLFGKTRDLDENYEHILKGDVEDYFKGKIAEPIPVKVCDNGDSLIITIGLECGFKCKDDTLPQSIGGILFGISKDFKPEYCFPMVPDFGGYFDVQVQKEDFAVCYRKNAKHYGATPVKDVEVSTPDEGGFMVKLSY